jgi:MFS superfamily sulfate permease-like transporter
MAYSLLATLPPIYGLYTSFYPVIIYWIFGTSRQISLGTFAVISLMVAGTIADLESKYVPPVGFNASLNTTDPNIVKNYLSLDRNQARVMIAMANAFWVGVIQLAMSIFQLGFITSYLSEAMINSKLKKI